MVKMNGKLTLCQYARVTNNGSQYDAIGAGVNMVDVLQFPAPVVLTVLIETKFTIAETGKEYPFEIRIIDEDGKAAGPVLGGSINAGPGHRGGIYAAFNIQFVTKKPVALIYSLLINSEEKDSVSLEIRQGKPLVSVARPEPESNKIS
jgi:hypothetical protein